MKRSKAASIPQNNHIVSFISDERNNPLLCFNTSKVLLLTLLFCYLGVFLFIAFWVRTLLAIPLLIGLIVMLKAIIKSWQANQYEPIIISPWIVLIVSSLLLLWCMTAGIGGYAQQSGDWPKHNLVLNDLINNTWPVYYEGNLMLTYYIGYYLFPALIGKLAGFEAAQQAMLLQTWIGLLLVFLLLVFVCKAIKRSHQFIVLSALIAFGPINLAGSFVCSLLSLTSSISWQARWIAIDHVIATMQSNFIFIRWVTPQVIVPWLFILLLLTDRNIKNIVPYCMPIILFSAFAMVGVVPVVLALLLIAWISWNKPFTAFFKNLFSTQNLIAFFAMFPLFFTYFYLNVASPKPEELSFQLINYTHPIYKWGGITLYVILFFCSFGIYALLIFRENKKNPLWYSCILFMSVLLLFKFGKWNDLCMRASIPALFVLMILVINYLIHVKEAQRFQWKKLLLVLCFIICLFPIYLNYSFQSFSLTQKHLELPPANVTLATYALSENAVSDMKYNYVTCNYQSSFFYKFYARQ